MAFYKKRIPKHAIINEQYKYPTRRNGAWRWLGVSALIFCSCLGVAAQSRADTQATSGELQFGSSIGEMPALHLSTEVEAHISGLVAKVVYTQHFQNQSGDWQSGHYTFPLPETASVSHMLIRVGERTIVGEIKEKSEAKRIFKQAEKEGKRAALTEQQRPNMFTQKIANIGPNETVTVEITYQHTVTFKNAQFEWRLPTTFTPRYIPGQTLKASPNYDQENQVLDLPDPNSTALDENTSTNTFGWARPTDQVPDAPLITPLMTNAVNPISINITLNSGLELSGIQSLYHDIDIKKSDDQHHVALRHGQTEMDRDFVLQWSPAASSSPSAAVFTEEVDGEFYSLLMVLPPTESTEHNLPRDIIFIIDTSGSMQGPSIDQAKQSLSLALHQLSESDRFNIIEFNSTHSAVFQTAMPATQKNTQRALRWIAQLNANGGTEMYPALDAALIQTANSERLKQLIFITDGAIGNEDALFRLIHEKLGASRLFTVGIGSAPNSYFMRKAAKFGRGTFNHIGQTQDITPTMSALFAKLNSAVSTNLKIDWLDSVEQYPQRIGELYKDEALLISAKSKIKPEKIIAKGELNHKQWQHIINSSHNSNSKNDIPVNSGMGLLWAREKIEHIEDQFTAGLLAAEDTKQQVLSVALRHNIVSRFTSFVAVEKTRSRPLSQGMKQSLVKNQTAQGQQLSAVILPQTATTAEIAWWLGLFAFVSFVFVFRMNSTEK